MYARARTEPPDFALLSRAAARLVDGRGVLSGYSAAELLGASCAPAGAPVEVTLLDGGRFRPRPGLLVHRDRVAPGELWTVGDVVVTYPVRTAWELARRSDPVEAVVAVDRLANQCRFNPDLLLNHLVHCPRARGSNRVCEVLRDIGRGTRLLDRDWLIYRYTKHEIRTQGDLIVAEVLRARERRTIALPAAAESDGAPFTGARRGRG